MPLKNVHFAASADGEGVAYEWQKQKGEQDYD